MRGDARFGKEELSKHVRSVIAPRRGGEMQSD